MPQYLKAGLDGQRGSVLAGVLALSLAMTIAAAGYILQAGATTSDYQNSANARLKWVACQSTAELAMRYMRDVPPANYIGAGMANNTTRGISTSWPAFTTFRYSSISASMGNPLIRAYYSKTGGLIHVFAEATFSGDPDTARISWQIQNSVTGGPHGMTILTLRNWKDTLLVSP